MTDHDHTIQEIRERWKREQYRHIPPDAFEQWFSDIDAEGWDCVRDEWKMIEAIVSPLLAHLATVQQEIASLKAERDAARVVDLPTGADLIEHWLARLPEGERRTLEAILAAAPASAPDAEVAREAIDEAIGYKRSSRDAYLVRLKARGLVEFAGRGQVRASEELFS